MFIEGKNAAFRILLAVAAACLFGLSGCRSNDRPTAVPVAAVPSDVDRVALAAMTSEAAQIRSAQAEAAFFGRVDERLGRSGVEVVEPSLWPTLWRRYAEDVGGIFDPSTGKGDEEKFAVVRAAVHRELAEAHGIDGILYLRIGVVEHSGVRGDVNACGGAASPYWPANRARNPQEAASLVRTACLVGRLVRPGGETLFTLEAPIEAIETYAEQTRAVRPESDCLRDEAALDRALATVLEPFDRRISAKDPAAAQPTR